MPFYKVVLIGILNLLFLNPCFASYSEIGLNSTEALVTFSEEDSLNFEGLYLLYLSRSWQLLFGGEYEQYGDVLTRAGITIGSSFNFGARDHNETYFIRPQFTFASVEVEGNSGSTTFLSGVFGKRFPVFKSERYTVNYTPSIGVSFPLSNTEDFDTVFSISIVGLSLVFR